VAEVSWRRTDQLGNFVGMLELGAINLDASSGVTEQSFGHGFNHTRLSGTGGPEEEQVADRASGRIQPCQEHLVDFDYFLDRRFLANNLSPQGGFEVASVVTAESRIKHGIHGVLHRVTALVFLWTLPPLTDKMCHWLVVHDRLYTYRFTSTANDSPLGGSACG
jgi:hypothetical protein